MRETVAVADLVPDDLVLPHGYVVVGHAYGVPGLPGTCVPMLRYGNDVVVHWYYCDSEEPVQVVR